MLALDAFADGRCVLGVGVGGSSVGSIGVPEERLSDFRRKVASSSPRVLHLAGELADGVIMNVGVDPDLVSEGVREVSRGAARAGRDLRALDVVVVAGCSVNDERARAVDDCRAWAAMTVRRVAKWMRGADALRVLGRSVQSAYRWQEHLATGAQHARALDDEAVARLALAGTPEEVRETAARLEACGVTQVVPPFVGNDVRGSLEAFGRHIIGR